MNGKAPVNRPRIRAEIRVLERKLSEATTSSERAPLLEQLEAKQAELRRFYAYARTLDANTNRLPGFGLCAPLEPDKEQT